MLDALRARGIALRDRPDCDGCVRITIGTQQEMERLLTELKQSCLSFPRARQGQPYEKSLTPPRDHRNTDPARTDH